nr:TPA_asm: coat protein [Cyrtomium ophiovirus]
MSQSAAGSLKSLRSMIANFNDGQASEKEAALLREWGFIASNGGLVKHVMEFIKSNRDTHPDTSFTVTDGELKIMKARSQSPPKKNKGDAKDSSSHESEEEKKEEEKPKKERKEVDEEHSDDDSKGSNGDERRRQGKKEQEDEAESSGTSRKPIMVVGAEFEERFKSATFSHDEEGLSRIVSEFVKTIPVNDTYLPGEVEIQLVKNAPINVTNLIISGTRVLDAILYALYHDREDAQFMFTITRLNSIRMSEGAVALTVSRNIFIAGLCMIFNRGFLPSKNKESEGRKLQGLVANTLLNDTTINNESDLADALSSAPCRKFPAHILLKLELKNHIPDKYYARIRLTVAGSKVLRYADLTAGLDTKVPKKSEDKMSEEDFKEKEKLKMALEIRDLLKGKSGDFDILLKFHPLNMDRKIPQRFTAKATNALIYCLTEKGRKQLYELVTNKKLNSFLMDEILVGMDNPLDPGNRTWPSLQNRDYDFTSLSVELIKEIVSASGKK